MRAHYLVLRISRSLSRPRFKVMLHGTYATTILPQHSIGNNVSHGCIIVPTLQRCVEPNIVVANYLVEHHL